jgi:anti-sigma regulatory factor (Ser/Thr protein kinase)
VPAVPAAGRPDASPDRLRLRHAAALPALRTIRRQVERWAAGHGITEHQLIDAQLAIGEAVSNGVEHGYRDRQPGPIEIELEVRRRVGATADGAPGARVLAVRIVDHGRWRPAPARPGYRGRGLGMIRSLTTDMRVTSDARGTEVTFQVPLRG